MMDMVTNAPTDVRFEDLPEDIQRVVLADCCEHAIPAELWFFKDADGRFYMENHRYPLARIAREWSGTDWVSIDWDAWKVRQPKTDPDASDEAPFVGDIREGMFTEHDMSQTGRGRHLGYWKTNRVNDTNDLPWPHAFVDPYWDPAERDAVANWMDAQPDIEHWRGFSWCRICGFRSNGTTDKGDGAFTWPAGLSHYVREHNVRPPAEFVDHAMGRRRAPEGKPSLPSLPGLFPLPTWMREGARVKAAHAHKIDDLDVEVPVGTEVIIDMFDGPVVHVSMVGSDNFCSYLRLDFHWLYGGDVTP